MTFPDGSGVSAVLSAPGIWSKSGTGDSSYFFGAVGAHTKLSPDALVGVMFEFDKSTQTERASSSEGDDYLGAP